MFELYVSCVYARLRPLLSLNYSTMRRGVLSLVRAERVHAIIVIPAIEFEQMVEMSDRSAVGVCSCH